MKKLTALLLCVFFLFACCVTAQAAGELTQTNPTESVSVTTTVPDGLVVRIRTVNAQVSLDGVVAESFTVSRQATPTLTITPAEDFEIHKVFLSGEDVTDRLEDGALTLDAVYEDMDLVVLTIPVPCSHLLFWIAIAVLALGVIVLGILLAKKKK